MLFKRLGIIMGIFALSFSIMSACGGANGDDATPNDEAPATDQTPAEEEVTTDDDTEPDATLVAAGEAVVKQSCIGCHGANLGGSLGPSLYNLESKYSTDEIYDILVNGIGSMPKNTAAGNEEAVIAYLLTLEE
jgi:mono/diheme cytochrome c family protein